MREVRRAPDVRARASGRPRQGVSKDRSALSDQPAIRKFAIVVRRLGVFVPIPRKRGLWLVAPFSALASAAHAQGTYADPAGSGAIVGAVHWIEGTLLGTVATVVAVVAVAVVGMLMLTGRMNWRYGAMVILGCFILFGATSIVAGIQATANAGY
jgi:type IV secretion system protein VirB2